MELELVAALLACVPRKGTAQILAPDLVLVVHGLVVEAALAPACVHLRGTGDWCVGSR